LRISWFCYLLTSSAVAASLTGNIALIRSGGERKGDDHSGVVVWLESTKGAISSQRGSSRRAVMEQRNKTFLPHVLAVEVGTAVDFPNFDPIFHNAFSNYDGQVFDLHLYAPQTSRRVIFRRPGMVRIFCNIHATMSAVIAVLPTPYYTVTGSNGRFQIEAPAGSYRFRVWHERSQAEFLESLEREVTLGVEGLTLPEIQIAEQGFLTVPHKNKYGRDYPPQKDDHVYYPGARR